MVPEFSLGNTFEQHTFPLLTFVTLHLLLCELQQDITPVSYTHLDVYKRQIIYRRGVVKQVAYTGMELC